MLCLLAAVALTACNAFKKKTSWNVTLDRDDKKPYGSYLAYNSLALFFPRSQIVPLSRGFRYSSIDDKMMDPSEGRSVFIALGLDFYLTEMELKQLIAYARRGNEVVIFSRVIDEKLERYLGCSITNNGFEEVPLTQFNDGSQNVNSLYLAGGETRKYGYQGRSVLASWRLREADSSAEENEGLIEAERIQPLRRPAEVVGFAKQKPDFIRFAVGKGHISLHAAPLVMSNYFLLQDGNYKYLESFWRTFPGDIATIYWNDYFKRSTRAADLGVLLKYPGTRWAFILAVFALLVYLLFESKRKQRIIPVVPALENTSVSFVETVGRLYFNKKDHNNIAEKMIQHFLEWVRTHYFMNTNQLNEHFTQQLVMRSGLPEVVVRSLVELIHEVQVERKQLDETDLYHLHRTIEQFYKKQ